jgi:predicted transcriptional regulator
LSGASTSRRTEKEFKQTKAIELYLKHYSQSQISDELEKLGFPCERSTISYYIKDARAEWRKERIEDMDAIFERELAELDHMEMESVQQTMKIMDLLEEDPLKAAKGFSDLGVYRLKIKKMRQDLLGLNAPLKMQHSGELTINLTVADCGEDGEIPGGLHEDD